MKTFIERNCALITLAGILLLVLITPMLLMSSPLPFIVNFLVLAPGVYITQYGLRGFVWRIERLENKE